MGDELQIKGRVLSLHLSEENDGKRIQVKEIAVDDLGVKEDKFYGKDLNRSILITATESYQMAKDAGIDIPYGSLGENIVIDYNPYQLAPGEIFEIGETVMRITQNCTLCKSLTRVDSRLPKLLKNDRGIFAQVVKGGIIHIGDPIYITSSIN